MTQPNRKARMRLGDISVNALHALVKAVRLEHKDPAPLLDHYHITEYLLDTPRARISIPKFMRIGHDAVRLTGNPALGLIIGQNMHIGDIGLVGLPVLTAQNLDLAISTLIRFELLGSKNCRGHSRYYKEGDHAVCQFYSISPYNRYNYFVVDTTLSSWLTLAKWITQEDQLIQKVEVEYPDVGYNEAMEAFFQCPVHYNQPRNALLFHSSAVNRPSRFANQATHREGINICEKAMRRAASGSSTRERVAELIGPSLNGAAPTIDEIAHQMGTASWTLRRHLKKEGVNYNEILDQTRKGLAESYVRDTNLNFTETAFLLGFSSPAAFQRAFKRWMNLSPGDYRRNFGNINDDL